MIVKTQLLIVLGRKMQNKPSELSGTPCAAVTGVWKGLWCGKESRSLAAYLTLHQSHRQEAKHHWVCEYWKCCKHYLHFQVFLPGKWLMPSYQISVGGRQCHMEQSNHVNIFICIIIHLLSIFYLLYELMCRDLLLLWCWFFLSENKISPQELTANFASLKIISIFPWYKLFYVY